MLKITSRGIPELQAWLKELDSSIKDTATRAVAEYLVGDETHGLKHEPYYKYVNRQAGFPEAGYVTSLGNFVPGFYSAKQHGYVMAMIAKGLIKPGQDNRTHRLRDAWKYTAQGSRYEITNVTPYAKYVQGGQQTRMHNLIGWKQTWEVVKSNMAGAIRHAKAEIKKWIAAHKRGS